jgi:hypothetical protein
MDKAEARRAKIDYHKIQQGWIWKQHVYEMEQLTLMLQANLFLGH